MSEEEDALHEKALSETGFWGYRGAGCIVLCRSSMRVLLPLRSCAVLEPGTWGVWGGAVDEGLTPEEAVLRELHEESGFKGEAELRFLVDFVDVASGFRYSNYIAIIEEEFVPTLNWETERADWFELDAFPEPLHFGLKYVLEQVPELGLTTEKYVDRFQF